ncbi:hypothetical protein ACWIDS_16315 [Dietzia maris]
MTSTEQRMGLPTPDPRCGSRAGYTAHWRREENACEECRQANLQQKRDWRAEQARTSKPPTDHVNCGTPAGAARHSRRGESLCPPCLDARREARQKPALPMRPPLPPASAFDGAACHPWTGLHDARRHGESDDKWQARLAAARHVCGTCPAFTACKQLRDHYKGRRNRIDGILAGQPTSAPPYNRKAEQ